MRKLAMSVDTRNRPMSIGPLSSYNLYYATGTGGDVILPPSTRFIEVTAVSSDAWVKTGYSGVSAAAPSGDVTDGTAPQVVLSGTSLRFEKTPEHTHISAESSGPVLISLWE